MSHAAAESSTDDDDNALDDGWATGENGARDADSEEARDQGEEDDDAACGGGDNGDGCGRVTPCTSTTETRSALTPTRAASAATNAR